MWRWNGIKLEISVLTNGKYITSTISSIFSGLPITQVIPEYLMRSKTEGRNATMKAFRVWVKEQI